LKLSQFHLLLQEEFGSAFSQVLLADTRITSLGDKTPAELLQQGEDPKQVWLAVCRQLGVPKERWSGKPAPKRHAE